MYVYLPLQRCQAKCHSHVALALSFSSSHSILHVLRKVLSISIYCLYIILAMTTLVLIPSWIRDLSQICYFSPHLCISHDDYDMYSIHSIQDSHSGSFCYIKLMMYYVVDFDLPTYSTSYILFHYLAIFITCIQIARR